MAESLPMVKIKTIKSPSQRIAKKFSIDQTKQKLVHSDLKLNLKKPKKKNKKHTDQ